MRFFVLSIGILTAGLLTCAPAFAQTTPETRKSAQQTAPKQHTDAARPAAGSYSSTDVQKQKAQSFSHSDPADFNGLTKQK